MIPPADPRASYLCHKAEIDDAVHRVLESGWYIHGDEVAAFERDFSRFLGSEDVVGTGSGTEALHVALRACGVGQGDFVLTVSHTAVATVAAIELAGAQPVFVDIDPCSFTMDTSRLDDTIEAFLRHHSASDHGRLKAIIPVHLYGHPAEMSQIMDIADQRNLLVIEDCAQAHGATLDGRMVGTWGHISAFSFYPTKNLGALGDAGAIATNSSDLAEKARLVREYGWRRRYVSEIPGMNSRLDSIQAAILCIKLRYLEQENEKRRALAMSYGRRLSSCAAVQTPLEPDNGRHVYHQYVIRTSSRDELKDFLEDNGIGSLIHYPVPIHLQPAYRNRFLAQNLENTEQICREILSLPIMPNLSVEQIDEVSSAILKWCEESSK